MSRYRNTKLFTNNEEFYRFLRRNRNSPKSIRMFETPTMHHPTVAERASILTVNHIWKLGDRYYHLAANAEARYSGLFGGLRFKRDQRRLENDKIRNPEKRRYM